MKLFRIDLENPRVSNAGGSDCCLSTNVHLFENRPTGPHKVLSFEAEVKKHVLSMSGFEGDTEVIHPKRVIDETYTDVDLNSPLVQHIEQILRAIWRTHAREKIRMWVQIPDPKSSPLFV